jgi:hypothetical protein
VDFFPGELANDFNDEASGLLGKSQLCKVAGALFGDPTLAGLSVLRVGEELPLRGVEAILLHLATTFSPSLQTISSSIRTPSRGFERPPPFNLKPRLVTPSSTFILTPSWKVTSLPSTDTVVPLYGDLSDSTTHVPVRLSFMSFSRGLTGLSGEASMERVFVLSRV